MCERLKVCCYFIIFLMGIVIGAAFSFRIFYDPTKSWAKLDEDEKDIITKIEVKFHGVDVKFGELFAIDSKVFDFLSSEQIKKPLKGETEELSRALDETFGPYVFLTWSNMTQKLKENFLRREVDFQGQKVSIGNLTESDKTLELLSSDQIREIFNGKYLKIDEDIKNPSLYIERYFTEEHLEVMSEKFCKNRKVKKCEFYKDGQIDIQNLNVTNFDKIVESLTSSKIFLLSSAAGDGKSTTFRHFSLKLKEKFPQKWIQFVDLKKHIKVFEIGHNLNLNDSKNLSNFLGEKLLGLEGFELEIFKELFASGNVIFLWDGDDEVSPNFSNFMLDLTSNIRETNNFQFISTRPQHSKVFQEKFEVKAQKLIPFSELDRFEFLIKTAAIEKFNENPGETFERLKSSYNKNFDETPDAKYFEAIADARQVFDLMEGSDDSVDRFVSNPFLISMICHRKDSSLNLFEIFENFVVEIFASMHSKGEVVLSDLAQVTYNNCKNIREFFQIYSLKLLTVKSRIIDNIDSKINYHYIKETEKLLEVVTEEQINRFGIIQISDRNFYSLQRTFAEFFVAEFLIENLLSENSKFDSNQSQDQWKVFLLYNVLIEKLFPAVRAILDDASKLERFDSKFFKLWNKRRDLNDTKMLDIIKLSHFFNMQNFDFKSDDSKECLPNLPDLNQIEKTFDSDFVRSILNYRQIGDILPTFYCSIQSEAGDEVPMQFLEKAKTFLNQTEIVSLLLDPKGFDGKNSFAEAAERRSLKVVKEIWETAEKSMQSEEQRASLKSCALFYSFWNKDPNVFEFLRDIYSNDNEIKKCFKDIKSIEKLRNLDEVAENSRETARVVVNYLRDLFSTENLVKYGFTISEKTKLLFSNMNKDKRNI